MISITERAKTLYRNYSQPVIRHIVTTQCLVSDDSKNDKSKQNPFKFHAFGKKKSPDNKEKQMQQAKVLFNILTGSSSKRNISPEEKKGVEFEEKEEEVKRDSFYKDNKGSVLSEILKAETKQIEPAPENNKLVDYSARMEHLIESAKTESLPAQTKLKLSQPTKLRTYAPHTKMDWLERAKIVANELGVEDIQGMQKELLKSFFEGSQTKNKRWTERKLDSETRDNMKKWHSFTGSTLDIFHGTIKGDRKPSLETWDYLNKMNLMDAVIYPPNNYFEELINWTHQGKLWHFPIDNEQGMDEEKNVEFTEHVFLEKHLESWCPKKGPIRHFMELVTVGLSKNNFLSVEKKKEHILWYKEYFENKRKLLSQIGAMDFQDQLQAGEQK